jgi:hypothetical protein
MEASRYNSNNICRNPVLWEIARFMCANAQCASGARAINLPAMDESTAGDPAWFGECLHETSLSFLQSLSR